MSQALASLRDVFDAQRDGLPGPSARRAEAMERFAKAGFPTRRHEDWRFTSLRAVDETSWAAPEGRAQVPDLPEPLGYRLVFVNGLYAPDLSSPGEPPAGVRVQSLAARLAEDPESLEGRLGVLADDKTRALNALNSALFTDGALLEIEPGVSVELPIELLRVSSGEGGALAIQLRHLISIGAGSRAVVLEHALAGRDQPTLVNAVSEVRVARDARLDHVLLQSEGPETTALTALFVRQEAGSHFSQHSLALGARLARLEIQLVLAGEGAHCELAGLYLGRGKQTLDHHTTIDHATPHTTSDELYKGILDDAAHGIFHGSVYVRPHAQKIAAQQTNRNLLLSDRATVNTKPQLEIYADDVRCSHGATIGQLDPDQIYYLRTRGIEADAARALLTYAFASEIVQGVPIAELRRSLEARVLAWLPRESRS